MKIIFIISFLILVIISRVEAYQLKLNSDSTSTIKISFVGDLMCHTPQINYALQENYSYNFKPVFRYVKKYLRNADLTIGNLETVLGGDSVNYRGFPLFNTPDEYLTALKYAGFDLLITANNHSLDLGEYGLKRTIKQIKKNRLLYSGTFLSKKDRYSVKIIKLKGIKISILSYTYGTNGKSLLKDNLYLFNRINLKQIKIDIKKSKKNKADFVIVYYHFGKEYQNNPSKYQQKIVDSTFKYGANIIIGSHTHVVQETKFLKGKNQFVAYSLGNFISNQRWRYSNGGVILTLNLIKNFNTNKISILKVDFKPTYVFKGVVNGKKSFIIIPEKYYKTSSTFPFFADSTYKNMFQSFDDTNNQLKNLRIN